MAFEPNNLRPVARNSTTGDIVWFYQSDDALTAITTAGYFKSTNTGLSFDDLILVSAADGVVILVVFTLDATTGSIGTLGGRLTAADIAVDDTLLPFIGGTIVAANVQDALRRLHQRVNLKVQNILSIGEGQTLFAGIDDTEDSNRKFRLRRIKAGTGIQVALDGDTMIISATGVGAPGNPGTPGSADGGDGRDPAFQSGIRRLHVSKTSAAPIDGDTPNATFTTIQAALNAAVAGDVITIAPGDYFETTLTMNNKAGTEERPIWVTAEIRGSVRVTNVIAAAANGTANWVDEGGGVFSISHPARPWMASHDQTFLFPYLNEADLRATSITAFNTTQGGNTTAQTPRFGVAFQNNRVFVKLKGNVNPNGKSVRICAAFTKRLMNVTNCDNVIFDGIIFEGGGDGQSVSFDENCARPTIRNCQFRLSRHGFRCPSNTIVDTCEYLYTGMDTWYDELTALNGNTINQAFMLFKGYYTAQTVSNAGTPVGGGNGNAVGEGSMEFGADFPTVQSNILIQNSLFGPCFDGSRIGEFHNSKIRDSLFYACFDDGLQDESFRLSQARDNEIFDTLFLDCFLDTSHQEASIVGDAFIYRCVFVHKDPKKRLRNQSSIKMISSPPACDAFYYHCTWILDWGVDNGNISVWTDFGGATGQEIERFYNNIVIIPRGLVNSGGGNPKIIERNAVVAQSAGAAGFLTVGGGVFAGTDDGDMRLNADFSLQANSPARNIGRALIAGHPDSPRLTSVANKNADAGAFPFGVIPGDNWPRPRTTIFNLNPPARWPFA